MSQTPREILHRADILRSRAKHMREMEENARPAVGLGIQVGRTSLTPEAVAVCRAALAAETARLNAEADALEATLAVVR